MVIICAEADESDGSFLCLLPIVNVVTNVDEDHLDHHKRQWKALNDAFVHYEQCSRFTGADVVCGDDPGVARAASPDRRPVITYGFSRREPASRCLPLEWIIRFRQV